ncbi:MAG: NADH-quinone oxidoreductase subunit N [Planctomycetota bacterium]
MTPWSVLVPFLVLGGTGLATLVAEPFLQTQRKHTILPWMAAVGLLLLAVVYLPMLLAGAIGDALGGMLLIGPVRAALALGICVSALCALAGLQHALSRDEYEGGEAYALVLLASLGGLVLVHAGTSIMVFLGIELLSLPVYALVGLRRHRRDSNEALLKYFVMSAVFSAVFLYGAALSYGATGSLAFGMPALPDRSQLFAVGQLLMIGGLLFKLGAVPFHFWTPDAYAGAPTAVTGFMGAVVKIAGVAVLGTIWLQLVGLDRGQTPVGLSDVLAVSGLDPLLQRWSLLIVCIAMLSILLGNFSALGQQSARRMLAFSSIAHIGYMLLALALPSTLLADPRFSLMPLWFYVIAYAVALSGLMAGLSTVGGREDDDSFVNIAGLARHRPYVGAVMSLCLVSLAGIPPTSGFLGKYLIFSALVRGGYTWLALAGMVLAVVGAAYYLRLLVVLWSPAPAEVAVRPVRSLNAAALVVAAVLVLGLLLVPGLIAGPASAAAVAAVP